MNTNTPAPARNRTREFRGVEYAVSNAHPAADAFPWLGDDELQSLADDIAANGQKEDIIRLPDKRVVDGRNREFACLVAGKTPRYHESRIDDAQIVALVMSRNVHRRHLDPSQRAVIAAELANVAGPGRPIPSREGIIPQAQAAEQLGVSIASVERAASVIKSAPELVESIREGKLPVKTAAKVAKLSAAKRKKVAGADDPKAEAKKHLPKSEAKPHAEPASKDNPDEGATLPFPAKIIPPPALDGWGIPIQPHATEAFDALVRFAELTKALKHAAKLFDEVASLPGGSFLTVPGVSSIVRGRKQDDGTYADRHVHAGIDRAIRDVKISKPTYTVCPYRYADVPHPEDAGVVAA